MKLALHLLRRHRVVYSWFWGALLFTFTCLTSSLYLLAPWIREVPQSSGWSLVSNQAPLWFLFVMGIILSSMYLPLFIAHGVTRREFLVGSGFFALGSSVLFGLAGLAVQAVEALLYQQTGIMAQLKHPYPTPTLASSGLKMLAYLSFMVTGFLLGLAFYRLRPWWAIALLPLASLPLASGVLGPYVPVPWLGSAAAAAIAAVIAVYVTRRTPVRPRKS